MADTLRRIRWSDGLFALLALLLAAAIVRGFNGQPYTLDAFYHYNAAGRIAAGEGFVDDYLWTYIGAPDSLPAPSHLYWMPGTSIVASAGMMLFGQSYAAAQFGIILLLWGAALLAYWLGYKIGGTGRHAWCAGFILLFGGFFMRWWGHTDTFAPYAFTGTLALALMGNAASSAKPARCWFAAGIFTAFGHLIRSDGLILLAVGWGVILIGLLQKRAEPHAEFREGGVTPPRQTVQFATPDAKASGYTFPKSLLKQARQEDFRAAVVHFSGLVFSAAGHFSVWRNKEPQCVTHLSAHELQTGRREVGEKPGRSTLRPYRDSFQSFAIFTFAYLLAMFPWFLRNLSAVGTLLPVGGTQALWYTSYNDLFSYPPDASPQTFFANGIGLLLQSRAEALFSSNGMLLSFIAVEGMIFLTPLMLLAMWKRRHDPFLRPVILFAIGIHLAFPLLFPFPGMYGGLFHAAAALLPWWAVFGIVGIDDVVEWMAKRRRNWRGSSGKRLFSAGAVIGVLALSLSLSWERRVGEYTLPQYEALKVFLPPDARLMINDPAQLYYYTRHGGVVLPNETPDVIPVIAETYDIDYLMVEIFNGSLAIPEPLEFDLDNPPPFLREVDKAQYDVPGTRLYEIIRDGV